MSWIHKIIKILTQIGYPVVRLVKFLFQIVKYILNFGWFKDKYFWLSLVMVGLTAITIMGWKIIGSLPDINEIYNPPKLSTKIYDRNGVLLYSFYEGENRSWVSLKRIPKVLIDATLAIEDKDFYYHGGLSLRGIISAISFNIRNSGDRTLRGGSTITQQLVKNVFFSPEKTWNRKIKEMILAMMIENKLTKDEILERYFNQVAYGGETYGVEEAALKYFGKDVDNLTLAEASYLAGLPAAPSLYSPINEDNLVLGINRQHHVIDEMVSGNFITQELGDKTKMEKINVQLRKPTIKAPHFVFYVRDYLKQKYDLSNFERRGLSITTTLDYKTQQIAENMVAGEIKNLKNLNISNGAALVLGVKTGDILAMVGSKDYNAMDIDGKFNVTTALRQPGSSIKPINYLLALTKGWTLASLIDDEPVTYNVPGQKPYIPRNYDNKFRGWVTVKMALASSLNIPSVKLLANNGVDGMIDLAQSMGITTWGDRNRFGLSLALGSGEVKMTELAGAYSIFGNMGEKVETNPVLKIDNYLGEEIFTKTVEKKPLVDEKYAFLINQTLSDDEARTPIFGPHSKLYIPGKTVAVKTGTTNNLKDNWCIGWTPDYLVAAWVGNNDNSPMSWVASGISGATPIWNKIMTQMINDKPDKQWPVPMGIIKTGYCGKSEYFIEGTEKDLKCTPTSVVRPTNT
ncbi:MAG: PBP1A family penicillin-binding protein [Candidatus Shapirobacteria bacterium]|nr:PBP1A family penicillin-binding protein [Candidatus Shapirobacteria bacterium]